VKQEVKVQEVRVVPRPPAPAGKKSNKPRGQILLSEEEEVKFTAAFNLLDADGDG